MRKLYFALLTNLFLVTALKDMPHRFCVKEKYCLQQAKKPQFRLTNSLNVEMELQCQYGAQCSVFRQIWCAVFKDTFLNIIDFAKRKNDDIGKKCNN